MTQKHELSHEQKGRSQQKIETNILKYFWQISPLYRSKKDSIPKFLRQVDVFRDLSDTELYTFSKYFHIRHYEKDEVMFKEGERGFGFYLIFDGAVKIFTANDDGSQNFITELYKYELLGELSLLERYSNRSASAITSTKLTALVLYIPDYEELLTLNPIIGTKVLRALALTISRRFVHVTNEIKILKKRLEKYES